MPDVIKVGVSAWPIVFAAVVAQVFKTYATWKVERGIKLMQLEQLVGSNSFGSAVKQPMVLRRLDLLSLVLLLTWCLSPFGSQALQRSFHTGSNDKTGTVKVWYLNQTGADKAFARDVTDTTSNTSTHAADNQMTAILFLSTLVPYDLSGGTHDNSIEDQYNNPILYKPEEEWNPSIAGMGLPVVLPNTTLPTDPNNTVQTEDSNMQATNLRYESFYFNITSSYFGFTCGNWTPNMSYAALEAVDPSTKLAWSDSHTLGLKFTDPHNESTITHLQFASANLDTRTDVTTNWTSWDYSFIQCDFQQHFIEAMIYCDRVPSGNGNLQASTDMITSCWSYPSSATSQEINMGTPLEDFSDDWTAMAAPTNTNKKGVYSTPSELPTYLSLGTIPTAAPYLIPKFYPFSQSRTSILTR